jgi:hypothetical protein
MICEGAFPLMETDDMNYKILENASKALTKKGKFIFTTLNGLFPLFHSIKDFLNDGTGKTKTIEETFDFMTFRDKSKISYTDDKGNKQEVFCDERYYIPSEIVWMLKALNFQTFDIIGCSSGRWSRIDKLTTEDFEMLVIADKE